MMKKYLSPLLALSLYGACTAKGAPAKPEFYVGVATHFAQNKGVAAQNMDLIKQAGIVAIRDEVYWSMVEKEKGVFTMPDYFGTYLDEAAKRDINPLVVLNYSNRLYDGGDYPQSADGIEGYIRYGEEVIKYAGDRVGLYQIWNEWDGGCGMTSIGFGRGTAKGYVEVIKKAYPRFKALAPEATFISNSVCTGEAFLEETFKMGMLDYCDAIGFHTYNYNGVDNTAEAWLDRMQKLQTLIRSYNNGKDKPVYITEMGWPNHIAEYGSMEQESAVKLARLYLYARMLPFVKGIWWYDFQDDGLNFKYHEHNFGLVRTDLTPKAPYFAIQSVAQRLSYSELIESQKLDGGYLLRFNGSEGEFWAVVNSSADHDMQLILQSDSQARSPLSLEIIGRDAVTRHWGYSNWVERQRELVPNQLSITVGEMPVLLSGDLGGVTIAQVRQHAFPRADSPQRGRLQLPRFFGEAVQMGQPVTQASFHNYKKLTAPDYGGPEDLSAAFEASYDRDNLYLTIRVTDNVFNQSETNIVNAWRGDSIQVAFQTADPDGIASRTELDAALINGKAEILVREAQGDSGTQPECKIEQQGNVTTYHLKLPASLLGQKAFEPGGMLACSFLVNDNDGTGRKGFITWGEGIGIGKNPSLYNLLTLR